MGRAQILTGARAKILVNGVPVGLFANCSWSIRQEKVPAYILGRYNPAEITPTSQEPVQLTLTGYRVVDAGPYAVANATLLKDLLLEEDFTVIVLDRRAGDGEGGSQPKPIFTANGCRVTGWSSGVAARGVSDIRVEIIGLVGWDEASTDGDNETKNITELSDGS